MKLESIFDIIDYTRSSNIYERGMVYNLESYVKKGHFLPFSIAIDLAINKGYKIARKDWHGNRIYVVAMKGYPEGISCNELTAEAHCIKKDTVIKVAPYFQRKNSKGVFENWTPSTEDIFATDWMVL